MIRVIAKDGEPVEQPTIKSNPEVIAHLERLLDRAKGGQIETIAFAVWGPCNSEQGYCGIEEVGQGVYLLGLLARLQRMVAERADTLAEAVTEFPEP